MTEHSIVHHTFSLERSYDVHAARVFAAWSTPETKRRWFAPGDTEHELDFRVGGLEVTRGQNDEGLPLTAESRYHEIVPDERIAYTTTLFADRTVATLSITTVEFRPSGSGAVVVLTESDAFFDGLEQPDWREMGTATWLDAIVAELTEGT